MSVAIMTAVWPLDIPSSDKLVLLSLADAAHDDGITWIAVKSKRDDKLDIMKKCSLSERSVQGAIKRLCADGYLHRKENPGRGVVYLVDPHQTGDPDFPLPFFFGPTPAKSAKTPAESASTPAAAAGKPSSNHQLTVDSSLRSETRELALIPKEQAMAIVKTQIEEISAKGTRLSPNWEPSETDLAYAAEKGFAGARAADMAENFRDYWIARAGAGGRKANWPATWRTWVRNQQERGGRNGSGSRPHRQEQNAVDSRSAAEELFGRRPDDGFYDQ